MAKTQAKAASAKRAKKKVANDLLVAFVLDMSGSMGSVWDIAIEGGNDYIRGLKEDEGETRFSLTAFDTVFEQWHVAVPIKQAPYLSRETYIPRGATALYDAIANTITESSKSVKGETRCMCVVLTDGYENSSTEYEPCHSCKAALRWAEGSGQTPVFDACEGEHCGRVRLSKLIEAYTDKGWLFVYLGAEHDARAAGTSIGMRAGNSAYYSKTGASVGQTMSSVSAVTRTHRASAPGVASPTAFADAGQGTDYRDEDDKDDTTSKPVVDDPPSSTSKPITKKGIGDLL